MKTSPEGYQVAVVGAGSLLGKELVAVIEERKFPVSRLVSFEASDGEPDLPIVDLHDSAEPSVEDAEVNRADIDFAFLAARPSKLPDFLRPGADGAGPGGPLVIDLGETLAEVKGLVVSAPILDDGAALGAVSGHLRLSRFIVSAHPAAIAIARLLRPLASRFEVRSAVAQIFVPASHGGPRAIDELQKQTVNLLSFQKIPRAVFGRQLAFNLLPRLGGSKSDGLAALESAIRGELPAVLGDRAPLPALRLVQSPLFYSMALSLYVELGGKGEKPEAIAAAITAGGGGVRVRRASEPAPSPVEATGASEILVDAVLPDAGRPDGFWLWAALDNLRLAAENAVQIAERLRSKVASAAAPRVH